jgi:hypothetical protein
MFGSYTAERPSQFVAAKVMCFDVLARDMAQGIRHRPWRRQVAACSLTPSSSSPGANTLAVQRHLWLKRADDSFHFVEQPMPIRNFQN